MSNYINTAVVTFSFLFLFSCANIKQPTGGPEDEKPPVVKKSIPANNSRNYNGQTITLEFDEYVDGQKLNENMIISPIVEGRYEIITKKKTVQIRFKEPFKENTTYNINLSESIKDVTRGNFIKDLNLAFSTGPTIDSLSVKGQAYDFISGKGLKDISIQLYKTADTNTVRHSNPLYFAKTDQQGNFVIKNVKEGTYNIYAIRDANKNFRYNEKEDIAYVNNLVVDKPSVSVRLGLTLSDKRAPEIVGMKQEYEYYVLTANEGLEQYRLRSDSIPVISDQSEDGRSIRIFNNFYAKDSIPLYYQFTDSSANTVNNTVKIFFQEYKDKNKKNVFSFTVDPVNFEVAKNDLIKIKFNKPVTVFDFSKVRLKKDTLPINYDPSDIALDSTKMNIRFVNKYSFKDSLVLSFEKGAFISMNGDSSNSKTYKFKNKNEEQYGILGGTIVCNAPDYIFQLINTKGKVVDSKKNATSFYYKMLEPGEYRLKVIIDVNKNGRWDPTDLDSNIPPEPLFYYKEKINLRANWELLDIKFEVKP